MKKFMKKVLFVLFVVFVLLGIFQYHKNKNNKLDEIKRESQAQIDAQLEKELLEQKMDSANNYVQNINNDVAITLLRTTGKITLSHDKTPKNNKWTEWLFNSDIKIYANYITAFTIESSSIKSKIKNDATILITYDKRDIELSLVDITNFTTSNNKSIFGSSYTPEQIAAFEQIARSNIIEKTKNMKNIEQAQKNLEEYFSTMAKNFNVKIIIEEK